MLMKIIIFTVLGIVCSVNLFISTVGASEDEFDLIKRSNELLTENEDARSVDEDKRSFQNFHTGFGKRPKLDMSRLEKHFRKQNMVDPSWLAGFGKRNLKIKSKSKFDPTWMVGAFGKRK